MLLREFFYGRHRFDEFIDALDISRAVLSSRLKRLEAEGIISKRQYEDHPPRYDYLLTDKGLALWDVLAAMFRFGDDHLFDGPAGGQAELFHKDTGEQIRPRVIDETTGAPLDLSSTRFRIRR